MKCFQHPQSDAVGTCKNCHKGLCQECAVDVGNGIACKDNCEKEVRAVNELIDRNKGTHQKIRQVYYRNAALSWLAGTFIIVLGVIEAPNYPLLAYFLVPMGLIALLYAAVSYSAGKNFVKK